MEFPRKIPSLFLASNFPRFSQSLRIKHLLPNTHIWLWASFLSIFHMRSSWYMFERRFNSQYGKMYSWLPPKTFEAYLDTLMLASYFATSSTLLCLLFFFFFKFLARFSCYCFEAFMSFVFFKFYMHGNLWMSSFQQSWPRLIWSYYRQDIMLRRKVTQC